MFSTDSDLEAFSHHLTRGSLAALAISANGTYQGRESTVPLVLG